YRRFEGSLQHRSTITNRIECTSPARRDVRKNTHCDESGERDAVGESARSSGVRFSAEPALSVCEEIGFRLAQARTLLRSGCQKDGWTEALCHPDRRLPEWRDRGASLRRNHGSRKQQPVFVFSAYGGIRG